MTTDDVEIRSAFQQLERTGYFNDESTGLGSNSVEHRLADIEGLLRQLGYDGPELAHSGHYYSHRGAVYWAYDPSRVSFDQARAMTDLWVDQATALE